MSAPRTSAAIADDLAEWRKGVSSQPLKAVMMEAIAALRPALPAEVEAVLAGLSRRPQEFSFALDGIRTTRPTLEAVAAALLRRYAQAVAEKDGAKCPCDVHACLATVAEKDAEIARLTAIEERAKSYRALLTPGSYCEISECQVFDDMTVILWEEH